MKLFAFAASVRQASLNRRLLDRAVTFAREAGAEVDVAEFRAFDMPVYDGDLDASTGLPPGARALKQRIEAANAVLIAAPEYNYSVAGALKNAIDWVSRARPMPWRGRCVYLMSASPSPMGGIRGLWHTRVPLEGCGALVFPDMFALAHADKAFDDAGALRDAALDERLRKEMHGFVRYAETLAPVYTPGLRPPVAAALESESETQPKGRP